MFSGIDRGLYQKTANACNKYKECGGMSYFDGVDLSEEIKKMIHN